MKFDLQRAFNLIVGIALIFVASIYKFELPLGAHITIAATGLFMICRESWMFGASLSWSMVPCKAEQLGNRDAK